MILFSFIKIYYVMHIQNHHGNEEPRQSFEGKLIAIVFVFLAIGPLA